ncbi:MAG: phosphoesterase, PA-phosphatase related [Acidobacteria bacterium]|nr:phosphoesterase, PA-phosphatase related [Acidobacteriota bacterium]
MPAWLLDLFARYGYFVVFGGVFLENTGLPVPGETALLAGAALAHYGQLSLTRVILTAIAAAILGDNLGFFIGRRGGRRIAERHGWRVGLTAERLVDFDRFFQQHGPKTVVAARFITGLRVVGAVLAGGSGMAWPTFLFYNATGAILWCTVIASAGYSLAYSWATLERWIGRTGLIALAVVAAVGLIGIVRARRNRHP